MGWTVKQDCAVCDVCGATRGVTHDREQSVQLLRAGGWRHMAGETLEGKEFETILCPKCVKDEKKKSRGTKEIVQDTLPLDFEEGRIVVGRQGISSR